VHIYTTQYSTRNLWFGCIFLKLFFDLSAQQHRTVLGITSPSAGQHFDNFGWPAVSDLFSASSPSAS
jgi:hypothetical protein